MRCIPWFVSVLTLLAVLAPLDAARAGQSYVLEIGETKRVYRGYRTDCGKAPGWRRVQSNLPITEVGRFYDGGTVWVRMATCLKPVAARAVYFIADRPGFVSFQIGTYQVDITVAAPQVADRPPATANDDWEPDREPRKRKRRRNKRER